MEKKKYLAPEMRMTEFENDEILTTSGNLPDPGTGTDPDEF